MTKKNRNNLGSVRKKIVKGKTYYEARYTCPVSHKQKSVSATTEAECTRKLREVLAKITTGAYVEPRKTTLGQWVDEWLEKKRNIEPGTYTNYESICRLYIKPKLGKARLQELRRAQCQEFVNGLTKSPKYIHNIVGVLSATLQEAVRMEIIPKNPAADLDMPRIIRKAPVAMESDLQLAFEKEVNASPYRNIFLLALHTGARISEVLGFQWKNVNLKSGEIVITGQLERKRTKDSVREVKDKTKTKQARNVYVPPFVVAYLKDEKRRQNENRFRAGEEWHNDDGLVFTREDGSPMPHRTVENAFVRIRNRLGHPEITLHTLRKTYITNEEAAGTDVKTIASMAGHSTAGITLDVYTASTNEMKRKAAERKQERHSNT